MRKLQSFFVVFAFAFFGCTSTSIKIANLKIKGSDTMLNLMQQLSQEYHENNPGITISVEGGGTLLGVKSLFEGQIDLCAASRVLLPEETKIIAEKYGSIGVSTYVARDAVCILVNKNNPVNNLTLDQVRKIFTCEILNWSEVGGNHNPIEPFRRNDNSGTAQHFRTRVLEDANFGKSVGEKSSVGLLLEEIEENLNAIGFSGLVHSNYAKVLSIDGVFPSKETIKNGIYPLGRYLYLYSISTPTEATKNFIDWILNSEGQRIIEKNGFIPLFENSY